VIIWHTLTSKLYVLLLIAVAARSLTVSIAGSNLVLLRRQTSRGGPIPKLNHSYKCLKGALFQKLIPILKGQGDE